ALRPAAGITQSYWTARGFWNRSVPIEIVAIPTKVLHRISASHRRTQGSNILEVHIEFGGKVHRRRLADARPELHRELKGSQGEAFISVRTGKHRAWRLVRRCGCCRLRASFARAERVAGRL